MRPALEPFEVEVGPARRHQCRFIDRLPCERNSFRCWSAVDRV
jgi:hypothetical protein